MPLPPRPALLTVAFLIAAGCGGGGGGGSSAPPPTPSSSTSQHLLFSKFRDFTQVAVGDPEPILAADGTGFDAVEVDGPAVVVDKSRPNGDLYMMWYEATDASGTRGIGFLTSDEENFRACGACLTRRPVILPTDPAAAGALFDDGATDPTVVLDRRAATPANERYKMWFEGRSGTNGAVSSIVYCESGDGENWTGFQVCAGLTAGTHVSFGDRVADPTVLLDQSSGGDLFRMWFEATDESDPDNVFGSIGYADSPDGVSWTVRDAGVGVAGGAVPVLLPGAGGAFSAASVGSPTVFLVEDVNDVNIAFHLWYTAGDVPTASGTEDTIGYATSANGRTWIPEASLAPDFLPVLRPTSDSILDPQTLTFEWDSGDTRQPAAYIETDFAPTTEGAYQLWYAADVENGGPNSANRIGYAAGRNP